MALLKRYNVNFTNVANDELEQILVYIRSEYQDEISAAKIFNRLTNDALSLDFMPEAYSLVDNKVARRLGIRRKVSGSYSIIYIIRDDEVAILHFYSNVMDIDARLSNLDELFGK